jgi:YesN/AraC family two-component response regulator
MVKTLSDILTAKGFQVYTANSGKEALQIIHSKPADILITDIRMPDMDGLSLFQRANKLQPNLVTYLMTAYSNDNIIQQGLQEGVTTVLTKPLNIEFLLQLLYTHKSVIDSE